MRYPACLIVLVASLTFPAFAQDNVDVATLKQAVSQNDPDYHALPLNLGKDGNTAHVTYDYVPTSESLKAYLTDFLPKFMKQAGAPANAIRELKTAMKSSSPSDFMNLTTHCDYDMAIDNGVVTKGVCEKVVAMNLMGEKGGTTERTEFSESFVH